MNWAQRRVTVAAQGRRYVLGRTTEFDGIWRKRPWGWRLVSQYPLSDDGWRVASAQFTHWEPSAQSLGGGGLLLREETAALRRKRLPAWGWVVIAVVAVATVGGGVVVRTGWNPLKARPGGAGAGGSALLTGPGYLATGAGFVDYVEWHDVGSRLSGAAQVVHTTGHAPDLGTAVSTMPVTGTRNGATVSLSFAGSPPTFGALSGGSFTVDFPQTGGPLGPVTFVGATATQYSGAVDALDGQLGRANQAVANAQALQQERHKMTVDVTAVGADIRHLSNLSSLTAAVQKVQASLQQVDTDLARVQADLDKAVAQPAPAGATPTCPATVQVVASDAQKLVNDASGGVEYHATQGVETQIGVLRTGVGSLQGDYAQLQSDQADLPSPTPSTGPPQRQVTQTATGADNAISSAVSTTNDYIEQANSVVTAAYGYVTQAFQASGCGPSPSAPDALQDIS